MGNKEVTLKIKGDSKSAESALDKVKKSLKDMSSKGGSGASSLGKLAAAAGPMGVAVAAGAAAVKKCSQTIKELTEVYEKQAKAEIQLEVAAKNNPYLTAQSVDRLKDYASHLQSIGTVGDEDLMPVMAKLAAVGRTEAEIQDIMSAALDMSAGGMISLASAADGLSKTLDGQAGELDKMIPGLKTLTTEQLKNGDAIRKAADAYAGMSEEVTKATGSTQQLKNAWGDFKENLGEGFSKIISPIKNMFTGLITNVNTAIAGAKNAFNKIKTYNDYRNGILSGANLDSTTLREINEQDKRNAVSAAGALQRWALDKKESLSYDPDTSLTGLTGRQIGLTGADAGLNWTGIISKIAEETKKASNGGTASATAFLLLNKINANKSTVSKTVLELAEMVQDLVTSVQAERSSRNALAAAVEREDDAVKTAMEEDWQAEVKEAAEKANKSVKDAKTLAELEHEQGNSTQQGMNDAIYNAIWNAYKTMVVGSTDPGRMQNTPQAKALLAEMEKYTDRFEKDVKYKADKSGTTKDDTPKAMQDWVAEIVAEVTKARQKQESEATLSGKSPSSQDKTDVRADAAYGAIVKVLSDQKFWSENGAQGKDLLLSDDTIKGYLADIASSSQWKEFTGAQNELSGAIKEFWENAGSMSEDDLVWAQSKIMEAYKAVGDVHRLTEKEQEDFNEKMKQLQEELDVADSPEKEADVRRQILELQTQYHQLSIEEERMYGDTMNQLRDELAAAESQRIKDLTAERVEMGDQLMQGLGDSARQAGDMVKEYFENNRQADVAEQQKLYEDGAISYEEYCDRVEKIDKEAAQNQYKIAMAQWVIQLAQATSNIALGVTKAISEGGAMGIITGALVSAAGAVNIASIVASKPRPPSFETGGIVPGTSYTGDRVGVRVNSGEGVFTRDQMKAMGIMARTGTQQAPRQSVIVNNNAGRYAEASADVDQNTVRVTVAEIMHSELRSGNMTGDIQEAQAKARGARYL